MDRTTLVGIATALVLVAGTVAGCDSGGDGDEETSWFQWTFDVLSGVPAAARPCRRSSSEAIGADPDEALKMIRQDCVTLIERDDCRKALDERIDDAAYETCHTSYCPTFDGERPRLCQMSAEKAVELEAHDVRWEEFYTYVLATDHEWAEPMPEAVYEMQREAQKEAEREDDSKNSGALTVTRTVDLSAGELVAQEFAGAMDLGKSKQRRIAADE